MDPRTAASLLAFLALAGCLSGVAPPAADGTNGPTARPGRIGVVLLNEPYEAAVGRDAVVQAEIPADAANLRFEVSQSASTGVGAATIELAGCGSARVEWHADGESWLAGSLCATTPAGVRQLTVAAEMGPLAGRILLRADLP